MKYLLILAEGLPDSPYKRFDDKTPLQLARTPNLDKLAYDGRSGTVRLSSSSVISGADTGFISLTGNNPSAFSNSRGFFEAKALGRKLNGKFIAFRVNLVSTADDELVCYGTLSLTDEEGLVIVDSLNEKFKDLPLQFYPISGFRVLLVVDNQWLFGNKKNNLKTVRPNMSAKFFIKSNLPKGNGSSKLIKIMEQSRDILQHHDINQVKIDLGENPTNGIWIWGHENRKTLKAFAENFGIKGYCVPGSHIIQGISLGLGMTVSNIVEPHGDAHSSLVQRVSIVKEAFENNDFVIIHVESINDISLLGDIYKKCQSIENFDENVVGKLSVFMKKNFEKYRILVTSTHGLKIDSQLPVKKPLPWVLFGSKVKRDKCVLWSEKDSENSSFSSIAGNKLLKKTLFKE